MRVKKCGAKLPPSGKRDPVTAIFISLYQRFRPPEHCKHNEIIFFGPSPLKNAKAEKLKSNVPLPAFVANDVPTHVIMSVCMDCSP